MRVAVGILMVLFAGSAQATAILDCAAPPYYLSFVVSLEHVAQSFTFHQGSQILASGNIKELKVFELKFPSPNATAGNYLKIETRFSANLEISGQAESEKGTLLVNGKRYDLQCYWGM